MEYTFHINHFATYGLNKQRNFMRPPKGEESRICLEDADEVYELCAELLAENGCDNSAIFLLFNDGLQRVVLCQEKEENYEVLVIGGKGNDFFGAIDAEFRLCCYGLMIEVEPGQWEICD